MSTLQKENLLEMSTHDLDSAVEVSSGGHALDLSADKWGELRDSSDIAFDAEALRVRMAQDGYLFLPGLLHRDEVLEARRIVVEQLMTEGHLMPGTDPMESIAHPDAKLAFMPQVAKDNAPLMKVLYDGPMMELYERLLGGPVRHFDYTWFRAVSPGGSTYPHTDAVYMNRGTSNLYTSWTPVGDVPRHVGGLMVLENSHKIERLRNNYSSKDVDAFCENRKPNHTAMGGGGNIREGGWLSNNPAKLRNALGGRWLTAEFRAGDVLIFSIYTVHASIDNKSDRVRLSSDSRYQLATEAVDERWIGENPVGHGLNAKRGMIC